VCTDTCFSVLRVGTGEQVANILECESLPYPTPLCQRHYHLVYDVLQSKYTHCCTCNSTLRNVRKRVCPNPEVIQKYLVENTGFEGSIPLDGRVCPSCYKAHLILLCEADFLFFCVQSCTSITPKMKLQRPEVLRSSVHRGRNSCACRSTSPSSASLARYSLQICILTVILH
jgi:hypothetical protein